MVESSDALLGQRVKMSLEAAPIGDVMETTPPQTEDWRFGVN
jgi:hypothetical protein